MLSKVLETALESHIEHALAQDGFVVTTLRAAWPNALAIYAFGSRVQGNAQGDSDLDLAVLVAGYADPLKLWEVSEAMVEHLSCEVDLLDMRAASTVMQYQVLATGRCLWGQQPATSLFECYVLSEKLALDAARAGLLADIALKGSIYA